MKLETCRSLARAVGLDADRVRALPVAGGDIADSFRLGDGRRTVFVKCMPLDQSDLLEAERDGLSRIADACVIGVPAVLAAGCDDVAWLALEYIELTRPTRASAARLGERLAALHARRGEYFGLRRDNYIGRTPQINTPDDDWARFYFERRIGEQVRRLAGNGEHFGGSDVEALRAAWARRFPDYAPEPSLIHGDLWAGNAAADPDGKPVVFDPAVHFADRECDLAMTRLFGGFDSAFYDAYDEAWPLDQGWQERMGFYQLYHVLNHANLFGGGYIRRSRRMIDELTDG